MEIMEPKEANIRLRTQEVRPWIFGDSSLSFMEQSFAGFCAPFVLRLLDEENTE